MRVKRFAVTGGRDFNNPAMVRLALSRMNPTAILVHGAARGADRMAALQWEAWDRDAEAHPADWKRHGKGAGPIRNQEMLDSGIDALVAFPGGTGTADMVKRCLDAGVYVIYADQIPVVAG